METELITRRTLTRYTGTEGPREDPYAYHEWNLRVNNRRYIFHGGFSDWISLNGARIDISDLRLESSVYHSLDEQIDILWGMFKDATGIHPKALDRIYGRILRPTKCCEHRKLTMTQGYPGEHFLQCISCGHVHDTYFNRREVE